jgi:ubiquinone/menaquinone biosynthesis C-methylase UbiE
MRNCAWPVIDMAVHSTEARREAADDVSARRVLPAAGSSAITAFDAIAGEFDERYGAWASVAAQRRAVRRELLRVFPTGSRLLELGGGTGEDALFLAAHGRHVLLTDGAPAMVEQAASKATRAGVGHALRTRCLPIETLESLADNGETFDGAFSNFAALNCVTDLSAVARALARLLPRDARALLVLFGPLPPGEIVVQLARGRPRTALRRLAHGPVPARIGAHRFTVSYPTPRTVGRCFAPDFQLVRTRGIGVFVPPSAAEPTISRLPRVLATLEALDRVFAAPCAWLGDHILFDFRRT